MPRAQRLTRERQGGTQRVPAGLPRADDGVQDHRGRRGRARDASTTITVNPKVVDRLSLHVNFDFNKATLRKAEDADLQKAVAFVKKYSSYKVSLEGYTDNVGSDAYNQKLWEKRAAAVKDYLVAHGADGSRIQTSGHGEANPVADNSTEKGRAENRRVEVLILSE